MDICHDRGVKNEKVHSLSDLKQANRFVLRPPHEAIHLNQRLTRLDRKLLDYFAMNALNSEIDTDALHTIERSQIYEALQCRTDETVIYVLRKLATTSVELQNPEGIKVGAFLCYVSLEYDGLIGYRSAFIEDIDWDSQQPGTQAVIDGERVSPIIAQDG